MRSKKVFYVVAYDVTDDRRRAKVVKQLERFGVRSNYSVFECLLTDVQYQRLQFSLSKIICPEEKDRVVYYPICLNCYAKIVYDPPRRDNPQVACVY